MDAALTMLVRGGSTATDSASGRRVLRALAGELLSVEASSVVITATCPDCGGDHGQPTTPGVFLSLSRCADALVAAASLTGPIGIDVEPRDGSAKRLDAIEALTGIRSLEHWTTVEAVLKADGRGLRVDPAEVVIDGDEAVIRGSVQRYRVTRLELGVDLVITLAEAI